ncbi:MAG: 2-oxoglutarate oxidoreductase, partial [Candidatus Omnitrophica bacterium]|nr:2-oxoglutarate oxidoreductase [Candidatus Omnitrophota bacterium]
MTGGQMAPTTLIGQKTDTTPHGRETLRHGHPLKVSELLAVLPGVVYVERVAVNSSLGVLKARKAIRKAFQNQIDNKRFSLVEILSPCPTYWHMTPGEALQWIGKEMVNYFPLGVLKG